MEPSDKEARGIVAFQAPCVQVALAVAEPELKFTGLPSSEQVPETEKAFWLARLTKVSGAGLVIAKLGAVRSRV
jgi:hypothetical protein